MNGYYPGALVSSARYALGGDRQLAAGVPGMAIDVPMISRFRAKLIGANKGDKTINNILAVLSKALSYAAQARVIPSAPCVGLLKVERPEIVAWNLEEFASLLAAAKALDADLVCGLLPCRRGGLADRGDPRARLETGR
jgi:hypothetical protein